ncbi:MAG: hypothetical protein PHF18_02390 [Methanosarcina sp.]|uniref:hypothetical protein n=1 Tax=Methanosarcina sp. TaxID=2213 RepID=UPI00261A7F53|nr:hypothetical protein [Methanosarcina sp.]MDD3245709.1 hypothetical protein [Methanosarcina sp.]
MKSGLKCGFGVKGRIFGSGILFCIQFLFKFQHELTCYYFSCGAKEMVSAPKSS